MSRYKTHKFKPFLFLLMISFAFYVPSIDAQSINSIPPPNRIILKADSAGHFRGSVLINNHPYPFLIDTGATSVAIPESMAYDAGLPFKSSTTVSTASGDASAYTTRIETLQIETARILNVEGRIIKKLDEILIGMNVLKFFRITQEINTLILEPLTKPEELAQVGGLSVSLKPLPTSSMTPKKTWNKTVDCDPDGKHCKTSYR